MIFGKVAADEVDETPDDVEEKFAPVGVRVRPPEAVDVKPADTHVAGYKVDEGELGTDDQYTTTVNDIRTTGIDPYNTGKIDPSQVENSDQEK